MPRPHVDCTTSVVAPVVDGIITGYQIFRTGYAIQASDSDYAKVPVGRTADISIGVALTSLFLASTIYGGVNVSDCRRLKNGPGLEERPGLLPGQSAGSDAPASGPARAAAPPSPVRSEFEGHWQGSSPKPRPDSPEEPAVPPASAPRTSPALLTAPPASPLPASSIAPSPTPPTPDGPSPSAFPDAP